MKPILLTIALLFITILGYSQRVNYPPAPSSVYAHYGQSTSNQLKTTLWSNDISTPSDWSFTNSSVPSNDWSIETDPEFVSISGPFQSSSASNGFLFFKGDTASGSTSDAYAEYAGAAIDLTGEPNIRIQFEQQYISDSNERMLEVSQDGITWSPFTVSDGSSPTGAKEDGVMSIDISSVAGNASDLHFRFHFEGSNKGYWAIDDIELRSIDSVDLRAVSVDWGTTGAWGVRMPYYSIWSTQAQPIEFCAIVENIGITDINSVTYQVSVIDSFTSGGSFISTDLNSVSISAGQMDTICSSNTFNPASIWGNYYTMSQTVQTAQIEQDVTNNIIEDDSFVLGQLWSQYYGRDSYTYLNGASGEIDASELCHYEVGNIFDIFQTRWPHSMELRISPQTPVGSDVSGRLYKFDPVINEFILVDITSTVTVSSADVGNFMELGFFGLSNEPLLTGYSYLVTVEAYGSLCGGWERLFCLSGKSKPNTSFLIDLSTGNPQYYHLTETPIIGLVTPPEINWGLGDIEIGTQIELHPNPANESTTLSFDLSSNSAISFELIDLSGKTVRQIEPTLFSEGNNTFELETSDIRNGVYFVKFTSDSDGYRSGSATKRIVIQH